MNIKEIFAKAITAWGEKSQINMVVEECSELIHAICRFNRKNCK